MHRRPRMVRASALAAVLAFLSAGFAFGQPTDETPTGPTGAEPGDPAADELADLTAEELAEYLGEDPEQAGVESHAADVFSAESVTGRWVVQLEGPPLASYRGGVPGLRATSPDVTSDSKLDVSSPASVAYLDHLADEQERFVEQMEEVLGRPVEVAFEYRNAFNGLAVHIDADEAAEVARFPEVVSVTPDDELELTTDVSHDLIRSASIWAGETGPDLPSRGEGVIVGLLDTGINPDHPSFAATDGEGYTHTNPFGDGNYLGVCDPEHPNHEDICNDKLIGAWNFDSRSSTARDADGHGSHTASTAAGNRHEVAIQYGDDELVQTIQGVAPRANVVSYLVCFPGCIITNILAAVDQAVTDGVDVINYSITGADSPWVNTVSRAFLEAFGAGVFVAASAGNSGPGAGTAAHTAPWNASVAATTTDRIFANTLSVVGPEPVPPELTGLRAFPGFGPGIVADIEAELRYSGQVGAVTGCSSFPADGFAGAIALIPLGTCTVAVKVANAANAGAEAVVLFERQPGPPVFAGGLENAAIPAVSVDQADGEALQDAVTSADGPVTVLLGAETVPVRDDAYADTVAWFSSRGPSSFDLLAPTLAAPGVNVFAAYRELDGDPLRYTFNRGTSMAAPHVAGAGALLKALHPDWSPAQIRSALAATADPDVLRKQDGVTPADPFDAGSGRMDLDQAGRVGLVLEESHANMLAANPATGGDPRTLNVPSLVNQRCSLECSWTREVTSVADAPASYTAAVDAPAGMSVTVEPETFTIDPGETQQITVTTGVADLSGGSWVFADLRLATGDQHAGGADIASVHYPIAVIPVAPAIDVQPAELDLELKPERQANRSLSVTNQGNGDLQWELTAEPSECDSPDDVPWLAISGDTGGTVAPGGSARLGVGVDTTGLSPGSLSATLCVTSNDPAQPLVPVPVSLTVLDLPDLVVSPAELAVSQPEGTVTGSSLTIDNLGTSTLNWEIVEAGEDVAAISTTGAATSDLDPERQALLRDGVLLVPDSTNARVAAFDPETGDLVDPDFITYPASLGTTTHVILNAAEDGFLISSQNQNVVHAFDLAGEYQGIFAPIGGADTSIMQNIRGIAISPWGTVLVTSSNGEKVVEFTAEGEYLGDFITDFGAGPWYLLFREDDLLVSGGLGASSVIRRYDHDGELLDTFPDGIRFPQQIHRQENGNLLVAGFSAPAGIWEMTPDGDVVSVYTGITGNRGAYALPGDTILGTGGSANGGGVHQIDRAGTLLDTKYSSAGARMITEVEQNPCVDPGDVSWLSVSTDAGATPAGGSSEVTVLVDSTGLAAGAHTAYVCVTSDDPDNTLVPVPVTVTVTEPGCDVTVTGTQRGELFVTDGLTCLAHGADVRGPVTVLPGGSLFASGADVKGRVSADGAEVVEVRDSAVTGGISATGTTGSLVLRHNQVVGPVSLTGNSTGDTPIVVAGNRIVGSLACSGNEPPPVNDGEPNDVTGGGSGQCADL